jgi:ABC-type transport system involved in cytochrome c biogenesis permease subunit
MKKSKDERRLTHRAMMAVLAFGLSLSFIGTVLGGIWADQSWGRFWGWDPKENGALLIVLWTAILYHGRLAGWLHPIGMAAGACIGIGVVMLAWFGINLLGVGLHSYGFSNGTAIGLVIYGIAQALFLFIAVPIALNRSGDKF